MASMQYVTIADLHAALRDQPTVIDVREPAEYAAGHVPGSRLVPLATVPDVVDELPEGEPVFVICAVGARSAHAAAYLAQRGVEARTVDGGTMEWAAAGYPLER
jgi:rhodanese-related sulfurtransferase